MSKIPVKATSRLLERTEQFVRCGLRARVLPIGTAVQITNKYIYDIRSHMLAKYLGISEQELKIRLDMWNREHEQS